LFIVGKLAGNDRQRKQKYLLQPFLQCQQTLSSPHNRSTLTKAWQIRIFADLQIVQISEEQNMTRAQYAETDSHPVEMGSFP
jgi:hypothetical protein